MAPSSLKFKYNCEKIHPESIPVDGHKEWTQHLIDLVQVVSSTKGRIRFFLGFEGDEILNESLRREAVKSQACQLRYYNYQTNTALYYYDSEKMTASDVAVTLFKGVIDFARRHGECDIGEEHDHSHDSHSHDSHSHDSHSHDSHSHDSHSHDSYGHGGSLHDNHDHGGLEHSPAAACGSQDDEDCGHDHSNLHTQKQMNRELVKLSLTGLALGFFVWRRLGRKVPPLAAGPLGWVSAIATIAAGYPIFKGGLNSIKPNQKINDDTLISIAVAATLVMRENITGLSVVWLINLGRFLEAVTLKRSREEIKALLDLAPDEAWLVMPDGSTSKTSVSSIEKNEIIRVFKGDRIALDGKISAGTANVMDSHLTGEPLAKSKTVKERVFAGSIVEDGQIDVIVENLVTETAIAKVVHEVERLRRTKAPIDQYGQKFASKFVPISLGISGAVFIFTGDWQRAITALVIACPCAAGLATPTAVSAGIGQAAKKGILIKGGLHLETASKADVFVFDKTGTLTVGYPQLSLIESFDSSYSEDEILFVAAAIEKFSQHPLAKVIIDKAEKKDLSLPEVKEFQLHAGKGVEGVIDQGKYYVGSFSFVKPFMKKKLKPSAKALTEVYVASAKHGVIGRLSFSDELRLGAKKTIKSLKDKGFEVVLLSGDRQTVVDQVAKELEIETAIGDAMPDDKASFIKRRKDQGYTVAMIGEGVNDAQALAQADVSIAIAAGQCDIAVDTADITITGEQVEKVLSVLDISSNTMSTIKQNFVASIGVNMIGLGLGAGGKLSPFMAAIVHNLSTIAVVVNSMRLSQTSKQIKL